MSVPILIFGLLAKLSNGTDRRHWRQAPSARGSGIVRQLRKRSAGLLVVGVIALTVAPSVIAARPALASGPWIVGNNAAFGGGPIQTYDVSTGGAPVASFVPDGASSSNNGRGLEVIGNEVFYTELTGNGVGPTDSIRVAPFNGGAGGSDTRTIPNPRPADGVQDLSSLGGALYALTGYNIDPPQVFKLDPSSGAVLAGPISIASPATGGSDGFVVLPNGRFLINSGDGSCTYNQYDGSTGALISGTTITLPNSRCTGVDTDGVSLFFQTDFSSITQTDMSGTFVASKAVSQNTMEDISLVHSATSPTNVDVSSAAGPQGEPTVAASLTDASSLVVGAASFFGCAAPNPPYACPGSSDGYIYKGNVMAYRTHNDGQSWQATALLPTELQLNGPICADKSGTRGTIFAGDPFVAASRKSGSYYYAYLSACLLPGTKTSDLSVARSTDGGATWTTVTVVSGISNKNPILHDKPMLTVDNTPTSPTYGRIYLVWVANDAPGTAYLALVWSDPSKTDPLGGTSWSHANKPIHVDLTGSQPYGDWAPYAAVDRCGMVAVIWYNQLADSIEAASSVMHGGKQTNGCQKATDPTAFVTPTFLGKPNFSSINNKIAAQPDYGINPDPSLVIDDSQSTNAGRFYALWTTFTNGTGASIILQTYVGGTWINPITTTVSDVNNAGVDNFFGQETLDPTTGFLHVSYYSASSTGCLTGCVNNNLFYARSVDGGVSFTDRQLVSEKPSDESIHNLNRCSAPAPYFGSDCFQYGDYEAIAVQKGAAHPVWTDARFANGSNLEEEVYTATIP